MVEENNTQISNIESNIEVISELVENAEIFNSTGYSIVKVTRKGDTKKLKLPIKSTGVADYMERLSAKAPRPPVTKELIKKNSEEGKQLGIPHNQLIQIFDTTDEKYIERLERHNNDFTWRVAIFALDLDWKLSDGTVANDFESKKRILQSNKITMHHIEQIFRDVQDLTQFSEEREDFLSEN